MPERDAKTIQDLIQKSKDIMHGIDGLSSDWTVKAQVGGEDEHGIRIS